jgi:hypothetical protein
MHSKDRNALAEFKPPKEAQYVLVSSLDALNQLRRDVKSLVAEEDAARTAFIDNAMKQISTVADLPSHAIFDRGRLVGLWEFDSASQSIAWMSFVKKNKALEDAVRRTEDYVRDQLGDARSFSLDSPKSRTPKIDAIRKAAAG